MIVFLNVPHKVPKSSSVPRQKAEKLDEEAEQEPEFESETVQEPEMETTAPETAEEAPPGKPFIVYYWKNSQKLDTINLIFLIQLTN